MSPSGGEMTLVDQPITWSPENSAFSSAKREAEMVRGVAGRVHGGEGPARALDRFAVLQLAVGGEVAVAAFLHLGALLMAAAAMGAATPDRRAGALLQRPGEGRVVDMGVGDEDMGDGVAAERRHQGVEMAVDHRPGIDHGHLAVADDIGAGAVKGESAGIGRHDAPDQRRNVDAFARRLVGRAVEGNLDGHSALSTARAGASRASPRSCRTRRGSAAARSPSGTLRA